MRLDMKKDNYLQRCSVTTHKLCNAPGGGRGLGLVFWCVMEVGQKNVIKHQDEDATDSYRQIVDKKIKLGFGVYLGG